MYITGCPKKILPRFFDNREVKLKNVEKRQFSILFGGGRYSNFKTPCTFYIFFLLSDDNVGKYYFNWKLCLKIKKSSPPKKLENCHFSIFLKFDLTNNQLLTLSSQMVKIQNFSVHQMWNFLNFQKWPYFLS